MFDFEQVNVSWEAVVLYKRTLKDLTNNNTITAKAKHRIYLVVFLMQMKILQMKI